MQSINNDILKENPKNYFHYFFELFVFLNKTNLESNYSDKFKKQLDKSIKKQLDFNPWLLIEPHFYHTFKKPHTWSLKKWRRDLRKYLRKFFQDNPHLAYHKLLILREFHQCRLNCHWIEIWNQKLKIKEKLHKNSCQCQSSTGERYYHSCKKDIHKMIISSIELDFSSWSSSGSHYHQKTVDPNLECVSEYGGGEATALFHPTTGQIVDEMTLNLCYINKDAEGRFKDPDLYQRHHDNPNYPHFDIFDYQQDLKLRNRKKNYYQNFKSRTSEKINSYLSKNPRYVRHYDKIKYLRRLILKARGDKAKNLVIKKDYLTFEFELLKKQLIEEFFDSKK